MKSHTLCKRCGKRALHVQSGECASCGYPDAKMRFYNWGRKMRSRRGQGTGRMRYLKTVPRRAKNGFRDGRTPPARTKHVKK